MKHGPEPLFGGRALATWVREGGPTEHRIPAHVQRLWWHAFWFEHNWRTQVTQIGTTKSPDDLVFIVGMWRSGTTVLHDLLARVTGWTTPQTWQCFNPSTCLLSRPPVDASAARPMDHLLVTTRGPQEDEFALLLLGEPSLYRAFIDPRRLQTCADEHWTLGNLSPLERWPNFLRVILHGAPGVRLLLKSPSHTFRLSALRTLFPQAKFIWIARDPDEVLPSNLRMWRAMIERYALWGCPPGTLEGFLEKMLRACGGVLTRCLDEMPRQSMLWVDFGDLRSNPRELLERAVRFLNPGSSLHQDVFERNLGRALAQFPSHWESTTPVHGNEAADTLRKLMVAARQRFGGIALRSGP